MVHNRVRLKRAEYNLTQTELGNKVAVTRQTIAFIEKGEFTPSVGLALKLAVALNTPIQELFWLEKEE
jgi:putative transcriptional regulator